MMGSVRGCGLIEGTEVASNKHANDVTSQTGNNGMGLRRLQSLGKGTHCVTLHDTPFGRARGSLAVVQG